MCAEDDGRKPVRANRDKLQAWETFQIGHNGEGSYFWRYAPNHGKAGDLIVNHVGEVVSSGKFDSKQPGAQFEFIRLHEFTEANISPPDLPPNVSRYIDPPQVMQAVPLPDIKEGDKVKVSDRTAVTTAHWEYMTSSQVPPGGEYEVTYTLIRGTTLERASTKSVAVLVGFEKEFGLTSKVKARVETTLSKAYRRSFSVHEESRITKSLRQPNLTDQRIRIIMWQRVVTTQIGGYVHEDGGKNYQVAKLEERNQEYAATVASLG